MRFDYLTDDSEKSLSPFFSPMMLNITFNCVWIFGVLLLAFWPQKELFHYLQGNRYPLTFLSVFVGTLLISSYVNLRCGRGEIYPKNIFSRMLREGTATHEDENDFLSYGFIQIILHAVFFVLLALPLLILSAAISGISLRAFFQGLSILVTTPVLCRLVSFFVYTLLGRWSFIGFLFTRIFFAFFFFATWVWVDYANPIRLLYAIHIGGRGPTVFQISAYSFYILTMMSAILILTLINNAIIRHRILKEEQLAN